MSRNEIIESIYRDERYLAFCKKIIPNGDLYNDLFHHVVLCLLEMPEDHFFRLFKEKRLKGYIAGMIYMNGYRDNSAFKKLFFENNIEIDSNRFSNISDDDNSFNYWLDEFDRELEMERKRCIAKGVYPSQVKLYEIYEQEKSYTKVAKATKIKYKAVRNNIIAIREKIINRINDKHTSCSAE